MKAYAVIDLNSKATNGRCKTYHCIAHGAAHAVEIVRRWTGHPRNGFTVWDLRGNHIPKWKEDVAV